MPDLIGSLTREFERLVRWVYPGLLMLGLLHLGRPNLFDALVVEEERLFSFMVIILVASFIVYGLHRYVLHLVIIELLWWWRWHPGSWIADGEQQVEPRWPLRFISPFFDKRVEWIRLRFGKDGRVESGYLAYRWAVTHAMFMTAWLIPLTIGLAETNSTLAELNRANGLRVVSGFLFLAAVHQILLLSRAERLAADR